MISKRIDGKKIADEMLDKLKKEIHSQNLHPHIVVFLIGDNPSSQSYIRQKKNAAEQIGARFTLMQYPSHVSEQELRDSIERCNKDSSVHGIIIQRPLPLEASISQKTLDSIIPQKDIDGFLPAAPYEVPVARAVITILEQIYYNGLQETPKDFIAWLRKQNVVVIGKGVTAGGPIRKILEKLTIPVIGIDRSTQHPHDILKRGDVIISCSGKIDTVTAKTIHSDAILVSVGISRGEDGKIHGDYEETDIEGKAAFFTPTPGGIGPVNVACLMQNLIKASKL